MSHQSQVENAKYRNWVKGQLAYKYLKDGIQNFTDDVIRKEHEELLKRNGITSHQTCGQCTLKDLLPLHENILDNHSNKRLCKRGQKICNCMNPKHKKKCPKKICDMLYEEILNSHASSPPLPEWRNTDISKWCTDPWEIAKCYINAPGYSTKHSAKDIDTTGLLHVFINNISYQDHFLDVVLFKEIREKRNQLIHSSTVEMEDYELWGWINDIIMLLEDGKELKHAEDAKNAVLNIKELKERSLIITTYEEAEVCREAMEELKEVKFKTELACNDITIRLQLIEDTSIKQQQEYKDQRNALADIQISHQSSRSDLKELTERVREVETSCSSNLHEILDLQKRMLALEETQLKAIQEKKNFAQGRIELQSRLVELFQKHYVKVSVCPLKDFGNDINVEEVYVPPYMEQEILSKGDKVQMKNYEELFQLNENNLRRIYIVGDVGSGKSAFCKKLLCDWCKAVGMPTIENVTMNQFAFLFYIPLRKLQGITMIREMIHTYYKNEASSEALDDILLNWPDKCLILIDGLDEWIPTLNDSPREHMTLGLPDADDLKLTTIITTSRPSAPGILNMISSDSDRKVYLKGIDKSSTELMVKKYMAKIQVSKKFVRIASVLNKLNGNYMQQIESTPLLLLQIVWLMCLGIEIGDSMSEIYSSFVNITLKWAERRTPDLQMLQVQTGNQTNTDSATTSQSHTNPCKLQKYIAKCSFNDMVLPKPLEKYSVRKFYRNIVFSLSKIAFEILTQQKKTLEEFGRQKLIEHGIDDQLLKQVLNTGIVTEENSINPMYEKTHFAFTHTSFLEYFAALHLASHKEAENVTPLTSNEGQSTPYKIIFARLIGTSQSIQDVIKLDNVLVIACGLNNNITQDICEHIYRITMQNGHDLDELSMRSSPFLIQAFHPFSVAFEKLQDVVIRCMLECKSYDSLCQPQLPMYYVVLTEQGINKKTNAIVQQRVDPVKVFHVFILYNDEFIFDTIHHFFNIQTISIRFCKFSQNVLSDLCTYISSTKSLRSIQMHYVTCFPETRMRHIIDLSDHQYLQVLRITRSKVFPFNSNSESSIEHSTVDNTEVINWLSRSRTLGTLQVHFVRLTRELCADIQTSTQLQELQLWVLKIDEGVLEILPQLQQLKSIKLFRVTMSATTWCRFVDSLGRLEQSVTVERFWSTETQTEERDYVKNSPGIFHVLHDTNYPFKFYTLK